MISQNNVIKGTSEVTRWWISKRLAKLQSISDTISINPFMAPLVMALHSHNSLDEFATLLLNSHFMTGHATGFGKLIDEKLLPHVFGATKLNARFRKKEPYSRTAFGEIDHVVKNRYGREQLLSMKASKWTIQLTMAVQLNSSFSELIELKKQRIIDFDKIIVGVFYGKQDKLTDKFSIIQGICSGAKHNVQDITQDVEVYSGRKFWSWLNDDEDATQEWVMQGIETAIGDSSKELNVVKNKINFDQYFEQQNGIVDWKSILLDING
jgi:hypothetical protein